MDLSVFSKHYFIKTTHRSSHFAMAYILTYVTNYALYFMCTIFLRNCSHISFACFESMSFWHNKTSDCVLEVNYINFLILRGLEHNTHKLDKFRYDC